MIDNFISEIFGSWISGEGMEAYRFMADAILTIIGFSFFDRLGYQLIRLISGDVKK